MSTTYQVVERDISALRPYARNARTHSKKQIKQIARSIERFGFTNPVLVSDEGEIIAGHGRVEAAKLIGWNQVPTIALSHLSPVERRAYVLADNKLALNAGWDKEILAIELQALVDLEFDVELTGFSLAEIDLVLDEASEADPDKIEAPEDEVELATGTPVSRQGDLWLLGRHKLLCGDSRSAIDFEALMAGEKADLVFSDPPYNVKIDGNVCGLGSVKHREFAFASGEMSESQFTQFLRDTLGNAASVMRDGAIAFVCMDWRHMGELLCAGSAVFTELKNLVVWNKTNGGMGAFYRSKHELIFVFKQGTAEHTNSFGLGQTGRYRTNVWDYAGISSISGSRSEELAMHPTVKPVSLIADAIRDCSRRGEVVLDCFGGSGSTLIAAEKTGRSARLIEYDPLYCDTIIRRWEKLTGKRATLAVTKDCFEDVAEQRLGLTIAGEAA
ncbi:DNA methyltransferase [Novosphingobium sp.]|jgi:DNA modification methylase|uniref:site-specific DNA-methyltransferase n=1 Tax=Novosphingobium sp. TaxID=1874826 RepID=UPI0022C19D1C|nr:DNA methyltransferase [Novosphingobium sp.]MCZ8019983.1 site-specific DNA-methyltransferase [Novosphingobium sp.]MCZ8035628.1 site-specific DNA-methyltransferase [Novosphingobium sp.]MCZ8053026.1 site-specific DNA-methyltransferase [Novosphingobium sp.]MCZ8061023.1 site-specific DNA-methyltransferase [Novosphingobium sp.]MCZ8230752.1 site-specific DNA-methyltransferase [Novosphingobium sp.]